MVSDVDMSVDEGAPSQEAAEEAFKVDSLIVSSLFWPPFRDEAITLPDQAKRYRLRLRALGTLRWWFRSRQSSLKPTQ